jgi:hypothetical protein
VVQGVAGRVGGFTELGTLLMPKKGLQLKPTKVVQGVAGRVGGFTELGTLLTPKYPIDMHSEHLQKKYSRFYKNVPFG